MINLLTQAEHDFAVVLRLRNDLGDEWGMQAVMFHLQQAIEKLLKAIIVHSGKQYPKTSNIGELAALCPKGTKLPEDLYSLADTLTLWGAEVPYNSDILSDVKTITKCRQLYLDLHKIVENIMFESETDVFKT